MTHKIKPKVGKRIYSKSDISRKMDGTFKTFRTQLKRKKNWSELLAKIGLYTELKRYDNFTRCRFIEGCVLEISQNIKKSQIDLYDNTNTSDVSTPKMHVKSSIKGNVFNSKGDINQNYAKIFDTSMRKPDHTIQEQLEIVLTECGYDKPLMFYMFDTIQRKGTVFITSFSEMVQHRYSVNVNDPEYKNLVHNLFKTKTAHMLISMKEAFHVATKHKRVINFDISHNIADEYTNRKTKARLACLKKLK